MKKIRGYTSIWSVEKVIYAINDLQLPFPITFTQMVYRFFVCRYNLWQFTTTFLD